MGLVPGPQVDKDNRISSRTRHRWIQLGVLPKPKYILGRQYFEEGTKPNFDAPGARQRRRMPTARQMIDAG